MSNPLKENKGNAVNNAPANGASAFFKPVVQPKPSVSGSNDPDNHRYEQQADDIADQVMRMPVQEPFFSRAPKCIQRQENNEEKEKETGGVVTGGAGIVWEQLKENPEFELWKEQQTSRLKYTLWESQPTELKLGVVGFGLSSAGILGAAFATDPGFRAKSIDTLQGV